MTKRRLLSTCLLAAGIPLAACGGKSGRGNDGECVAPLLVGDIVVSEFMANPPGADEGNEWIEIYNASGSAVDLTGMTVQFTKADGSGAQEHIIDGLVLEDGQYLAMGDLLNEPDILPAHIGYGYGSDLGSFNNTAGRIRLGCGESLIDEALYDDPADGASRGFDGTRTPDAAGNDDISAWCDAVTPFGEDGFATPGEANDPCFGSTPTVCDDGGSERDVVAPQPGDIVISEFMPNPSAVSDDEGEWFEIYVANPVDLNGLAIGKPGADEPEMVVGDTACIAAAAGSYYVFARGSDPALNGGLPRVDQEFSFSLSNSDAGLVLSWGDTVLDEVNWTSSFDGAASNLDPDLFDPASNDGDEAFCEATDPYGDGDLGTPGSANVQCPMAVPAGQCSDGGNFVPIEKPSMGDLTITEFMPNPSAVGDTDGEWFEIRANAMFHVNGLELGREDVDETVEVEECIAVAAGDYVLFAKNPDMAANGGLPADPVPFGFSLVNSSGRLFVGVDGTVIDEVTWASSSDGAATSLDGALFGPADNDNPDNLCDAVDPYGDGDLGTPGAANPSCGGTPGGMCDDGGNLRATVAPGAGDLVITELMPNPAAVADTAGEWFEVLVTSNVDLNGLEFGTTIGDPDVTLPAGGPCLAAQSGDRVVFARGDMAATNGGISNVLATFSFGLVNTNGTLFVGYGGTSLDDVTWTTSPDGASLNLDPGSENTTANDDEMNFCAATMAYGDGDFGSPGTANETCP
jgi:hypothetical protein